VDVKLFSDVVFSNFVVSHYECCEFNVLNKCALQFDVVFCCLLSTEVKQDFSVGKMRKTLY